MKLVSAAEISRNAELFDYYGPTWPESPLRTHETFTLTSHLRAYRTRSLAYQRAPVTSFWAQLTVLQPAEDPRDRMTPLAGAVSRVWTPAGSQAVTLLPDTNGPSGLAVTLAGVAPRASRHVAGALTLSLLGDQLGPAVEWGCPLEVGSTRLDAFPLRWPRPGLLYVRTRIVSGPAHTAQKGLPPTT